MRLLLDECLPKDLALDLPGHAVETVRQMNWLGISNGRLLKLIAASGAFDVFVTVDKNLPHQNKVNELPFAIVVLRAKSNRLPDVLPFASEILRRLPEFQPGHVFILSRPD
jgi:predicted nuclease of predicted toxin-antitoxin system